MQMAAQHCWPTAYAATTYIGPSYPYQMPAYYHGVPQWNTASQCKAPPPAARDASGSSSSSTKDDEYKSDECSSDDEESDTESAAVPRVKLNDVESAAILRVKLNDAKRVKMLELMRVDADLMEWRQQSRSMPVSARRLELILTPRTLKSRDGAERSTLVGKKQSSIVHRSRSQKRRRHR